MEPSDKTLLRHNPRDPKTGILTKLFAIELLVYGGLIATVTKTAYYKGLAVDPMTASTMAFATLTFARLFHGFNCRSEFSLFKIGITGNMWSVAAFVTGVLLLAFVLFVPFMQKLFVIAPLLSQQVLWIAGLAVLPTLIIQITRKIRE